MQLRYMGFDQAKNIREYRFDGTAAGEATKHVVISVEVALFAKHCIGVREGPSLCLQKLAADLETSQQSPGNNVTCVLVYLVKAVLAQFRGPAHVLQMNALRLGLIIGEQQAA